MMVLRHRVYRYTKARKHSSILVNGTSSDVSRRVLTTLNHFFITLEHIFLFAISLLLTVLFLRHSYVIP